MMNRSVLALGSALSFYCCYKTKDLALVGAFMSIVALPKTTKLYDKIGVITTSAFLIAMPSGTGYMGYRLAKLAILKG
jgi:hypothetical protein